MLPASRESPPILTHFLSLQNADIRPKAKVLAKDLQSGSRTVPWELLTWGHGYACVSTDVGPKWFPARCVEPALKKQQATTKDPEVPAEASEDILSNNTLFDGK